VLTPLPGAAQYLVYEPTYAGSYTVMNSCNPPAVANTSFETQLTPEPGGGYSFKPGPMGSGPGAILDVSSGVLGPQTCTLSVSDDHGNSATIAVTNKQLLLYPESGARLVPGAIGKATLNAPVDPGSPGLLTLSANGEPTAETCMFAVSDSIGNQAFAEAYYEGVP
jgi:hypothetical protein